MENNSRGLLSKINKTIRETNKKDYNQLKVGDSLVDSYSRLLFNLLFMKLVVN